MTGWVWISALSVVETGSSDWFSGYYPQGWGYLDPFRFTHGAAEVWKTPDAMNFVDADLKEMIDAQIDALMQKQQIAQQKIAEIDLELETIPSAGLKERSIG